MMCIVPTWKKMKKPCRKSHRGFVLLEIVIVFLILATLIGLASLNLVGLVQRTRLDEDVSRFAQTLRLAAEQAVFLGRDIEILLEVTDGYYTVYEASGLETEEGQESEAEQKILIPTRGLNRSYIDVIEYEDGSRQYSGELVLKATPEGWSSTVLFSLLDDRDEHQRYLRCDRMTTRVIVSSQEPEFPEPQAEL